MRSNALISVVVPVYNVESYLHRCVDSILAQTFTNFELILVDDGSPDGCPAICDEYAEKDSRVVVIHQANGGLSAARNAGIDWAFANSDSQWIMFVDSDDWIHTRMLELTYTANKNNNTSICMCKYIRVNDEAIIPTETIDEETLVLAAEEAWCDMVTRTHAVCKLYHKKMFAHIRYPLRVLHEDTFTTHKVFFQTDKISVLNTPLYFYYRNYDSITGRWKPQLLDVLEAHQEQLDYFKCRDLMRAYKQTCIDSLEYCMLMMTEIDAESHPSSVKKLRKGIRLLLKRSKNALELSPSKNSYYYDVAYPTEMKFYWFMTAFQRKLKEKGLISTVKSVVVRVFKSKK